MIKKIKNKYITPRQIAVQCARVCDSKKAKDIAILDVKDFIGITNLFVISSGINGRQLQAISDEIDKQMKKLKYTKFGIEGYSEAKWILMDYGDVVVHLFLEDVRKFYDLELLWGDCPKIKWRRK